jgi:hypothetical protein
VVGFMLQPLTSGKRALNMHFFKYSYNTNRIWQYTFKNISLTGLNIVLLSHLVNLQAAERTVVQFSDISISLPHNNVEKKRDALFQNFITCFAFVVCIKCYFLNLSTKKWLTYAMAAFITSERESGTDWTEGWLDVKTLCQRKGPT